MSSSESEEIQPDVRRKNEPKPNAESESDSDAESDADVATGAKPDTKAADAAGDAKEADSDKPKTFAELGVCPELCDACDSLGFKHATPIQAESIPHALAGRDVIGLAQTGSGKTAAFALPILQKLLSAGAKPPAPFAVVVAPTRELAFQINETFQALGAGIGARSVVVSGGVDSMAQAVALAKRPHIVVATPGRLVDHLEHTKGFSLRAAQFLVLDEADRLLTMDFEKELAKVVSSLPRERRSFLFSATMTSKVHKLQRASLSDPVRVAVAGKYSTVESLVQHYLFIPDKYKDVYLVFLLSEFAGNSAIVFVDTQRHAQRITILLRALGVAAVCIHGGMQQPKRLAALDKFKAGERGTLIATDVAARGLDIPRVDLVINYDIPNHGKDYVHRVGRTARAGRAGRALNLVSQYDLHNYREIEELIGKKLDAFPAEEATVLLLSERVAEAQLVATAELKELMERRGRRRAGKRGGRGDAGDDEATRLEEQVGAGTSSYLNAQQKRMGGGRARKRQRRVRT